MLMDAIEDSGGVVIQMKDFPKTANRLSGQCGNCGSYVCAGCRGMNVPLDDLSLAGESRKPGDPFIKHDDGKPRMDLLQPLALIEVAKVLAKGAAKYGDSNWRKGTAWSRYYSALQRHLNAWWAGEKNDTEDGLGHLAHAACCLMFLQSYELERLGTDDRPCCCGAPNDKQATHSPDACAGPTSAVGKLHTPEPPPPEVTLFPIEEGRVALEANLRLAPFDSGRLIFGGYRYQSAEGRVAYIVCVRLVGQGRMAVGSAVLQPGDVEDRKIGLQIAVGQALKNHARKRSYRPLHPMDVPILAPATGLFRKVHREKVVPIAKIEIAKADFRKNRPRTVAELIDSLQRSGRYSAPPRF